MYGRKDGHLRPVLLGRLGGVDLKTKSQVWSPLMTMRKNGMDLFLTK